MSEIQRYRIGRVKADEVGHRAVALVPSDNGESVLFTDHAKRVQELEEALRELKCRIETLIGTVCKRCERGDPLFVEPSTGHCTHSLGGNYCDAHTFHSLLDTEVSKQGRAALRK